MRVMREIMLKETGLRDSTCEANDRNEYLTQLNGKKTGNKLG